jgi:CubicO group peptidase (beta-lactamase class C family)
MSSVTSCHRPGTVSRLWLPVLLVTGLSFVAVTPLSSQTSDERVDRIFADLDRDDSPGCVVGVGQNGRILHVGAYGMANLEHGVPLTTRTIVEIGSVSKQFATGTVVWLEQEGKLSLDDEVRKWVPELPDFVEGITIRHLANHTSGLRGQWELLDLKGTPRNYTVHSIPLILDLILQQRALNFEPNDQYLYSNSGYSLLNVIVQRATGESLADYSREHLFRPLGMLDTQWRDDFTRVVEGRAYGYSVSVDGEFHTLMPITNAYANGGLLTTVEDMIRWTEALHADRIGQPGFRETMTTRGVLNSGRQIEYALGLRVSEYNGLREVSHGGSTAGYRANLRHFPDVGLTVALGCNVTTANPGERGRQVADIFLADHAEVREPSVPSIVPLPPAELEARAGLYRNSVSEEVMWLQARDDHLVASPGGGFELMPVGENRFRRVGTEIEFRITSPRAGAPMEFRRVDDDDPTATFVMVPAASPTASELNEYSGDYYSPELDVTFTVRVEDGELVLLRPVRSYQRVSLADGDGVVLGERVTTPDRLTATFVDGFVMAGFRIVFSRDRGNAVDGMELYGNRVRHLGFHRR